MIDSRARWHRRNDPNVGEFLETVEHGSQEESFVALAEAAPRGLTLETIMARTGWMEAEIRQIATELVEKKQLRLLGEQPFSVAPETAVNESSTKIKAAVDEFHRLNPLLPGIPKQELRARAGNAGAGVFQAALEDLVKARAVSVTGDLVQRAGREIKLAPDEARAKETIEQEFARAGLTVPSVSAVLGKLPVEARRAEKILQILLRENVLVKVADDLVFHRSAVARLRELIAGYRKSHGDRLPITTFKELTGVTRKYAIPLLEYLDREHVTRRAGDERVIL